MKIVILFLLLILSYYYSNAEVIRFNVDLDLDNYYNINIDSVYFICYFKSKCVLNTSKHQSIIYNNQNSIQLLDTTVSIDNISDNDTITSFVDIYFSKLTNSNSFVDSIYWERRRFKIANKNKAFNYRIPMNLKTICYSELRLKKNILPVSPIINESFCISEIDNRNPFNSQHDTLRIFTNADFYSLDSGLYIVKNCENNNCDSNFIFQDGKYFRKYNKGFKVFQHFFRIYINDSTFKIVNFLNDSSQIIKEYQDWPLIINYTFDTIYKSDMDRHHAYLYINNIKFDITDSLVKIANKCFSDSVEKNKMEYYFDENYFAISRNSLYYMFYKGNIIDTTDNFESWFEGYHYSYFDVVKTKIKDKINIFELYKIFNGKKTILSNEGVVYSYLDSLYRAYNKTGQNSSYKFSLKQKVNYTYIINANDFCLRLLFYDSKYHVFFEPKIKWMKFLPDTFEEVEDERYK